jgi:hypothetical protein
MSMREPTIEQAVAAGQRAQAPALHRRIRNRQAASPPCGIVPDWRWMLDRSDSPWYPSLRLFRQPAVGDGSALIEQVAQALKYLRLKGHP